MEFIQKQLYALQNPGYREFQCKLMPTVDPETVIGVRMPALRKLARSLSKEEAECFCFELPHRYYEENNLHGILLSAIQDPAEAIRKLSSFLPYVDNWATCDLIRPVSFRQHPASLIPAIRKWLDSSQPYTVRFGMEMLMVFYLKDAYDPIFPEWVAAVRSEEYYVRMMVAWYFAEALAIRYDDVFPYLSNCRLEPWVHNMTIRKACESYRISAEKKKQLKELRIR